MHVVGVVLRVVVLDEKRRSLQAIRVLGVAFEAAPPGQPNLAEARRFELRLAPARMSDGQTLRYSASKCRKSSCWSFDISAAGSPTSGVRTGLQLVGAPNVVGLLQLIRMAFICSGVAARTISRAMSSSGPSGRRVRPGPASSWAGLAPKNSGVLATTRPSLNTEIEREVMPLEPPAPLAAPPRACRRC